MNSNQTEQLFGLTDDHLAAFKQGDDTYYLHKNVIEPFNQLKQSAAAQNINISIASSYRSFERQAIIWNEKFIGKRPVFDKNNQLVDVSLLSDWQKVQAILTFSALPGASRHHWGTDIDIFDANVMPNNYQLQLSPEEYGPSGLFKNLSNWLQDNISHFGFHQPYLKTDMGIAQELWHISFTQQALNFSNDFKNTSIVLLKILEQEQIQGFEVISKNFDHILQNYVYCAALPELNAAR